MCLSSEPDSVTTASAIAVSFRFLLTKARALDWVRAACLIGGRVPGLPDAGLAFRQLGFLLSATSPRPAWGFVRRQFQRGADPGPGQKIAAPLVSLDVSLRSSHSPLIPLPRTPEWEDHIF